MNHSLPLSKFEPSTLGLDSANYLVQNHAVPSKGQLGSLCRGEDTLPVVGANILPFDASKIMNGI